MGYACCFFAYWHFYRFEVTQPQNKSWIYTAGKLNEREESFMILRKDQRKTSSPEDWTGYYKKDTCLRVGINPDLPLVVCGRAPEPQYSWNEKTGKYDGKVNAYGYWLNQFIKDSEGVDWIQNPILVIVDGDQPLQFKFGQEVRLDGLGGYYSRRKYRYQFRAKAIHHV